MVFASTVFPAMPGIISALRPTIPFQTKKNHVGGRLLTYYNIIANITVAIE